MCTHLLWRPIGSFAERMSSTSVVYFAFNIRVRVNIQGNNTYILEKNMNI